MRPSHQHKWDGRTPAQRGAGCGRCERVGLRPLEHQALPIRCSPRPTHCNHMARSCQGTDQVRVCKPRLLLVQVKQLRPRLHHEAIPLACNAGPRRPLHRPLRRLPIQIELPPACPRLPSTCVLSPSLSELGSLCVQTLRAWPAIGSVLPLQVALWPATADACVSCCS